MSKSGDDVSDRANFLDLCTTNFEISRQKTQKPMAGLFLGRGVGVCCCDDDTTGAESGMDESVGVLETIGVC